MSDRSEAGAGDTHYWQCPFPLCRYIITDIQYKLARFDYTCPKCRRTTLSEFNCRAALKAKEA